MMEEQGAAVMKERVKERYGKIALTGNSDCCCMPGECCDGGNSNSPYSPMQAATVIGYDTKELELNPSLNHRTLVSVVEHLYTMLDLERMKLSWI
jgi:hypothetical protein